MRKWFKTWIDWWLFVPLSLTLAIGSYWFIPALLLGLGVSDKDMSYTGTAWLYMTFQVVVLFMLGLGTAFMTFRFFFPDAHKRLESDEFEKALSGQDLIVIPILLFIAFCVLCVAVFP